MINDEKVYKKVIQYSVSTDVNSGVVCWLHLWTSSDYFDFFLFFSPLGVKKPKVFYKHGKLAQTGIVNILQIYGVTHSSRHMYMNVHTGFVF